VLLFVITYAKHSSCNCINSLRLQMPSAGIEVQLL
jgi:hypothetical protein